MVGDVFCVYLSQVYWHSNDEQVKQSWFHIQPVDGTDSSCTLWYIYLGDMWHLFQCTIL